MKMMKIMIILFALQVTTVINLYATEVKVATNSDGTVDYKWFYENGVRSKYEDWDNGNKIKVVEFDSKGKVTVKRYYTNYNKLYKVENWANGRITSIDQYSGGKLKYTTYYKQGSRYTRRKFFTSDGAVTMVRLYRDSKLYSQHQTKYRNMYGIELIDETIYYDSNGKWNLRVFSEIEGRTCKERWSNGVKQYFVCSGYNVNRVYLRDYRTAGRLIISYYDEFSEYQENIFKRKIYELNPVSLHYEISYDKFGNRTKVINYW